MREKVFDIRGVFVAPTSCVNYRKAEVLIARVSWQVREKVFDIRGVFVAPTSCVNYRKAEVLIARV
ncbi:hypothetical protein CKQ79_30105, partial [Klebsiella pneumoniae]